MDRSEQPTVIPPYLLQRVASAKRLRNAATAAQDTLIRQEPGRRAAIEQSGQRKAKPAPTESDTRALTREIADAGGTDVLPGSRVRSEGEPESDDQAVNEAYDGLGHTYSLFDEVFGRSSIDGRGMPLRATVHYGKDYDNAFWNGTRMVFGDGDGEVFNRFTVSLSIIGHELTHGVTELTAALRYSGQSGALNESLSDVFGSLVEQYAKSQTVDEASWLIGEGLFTDAVNGEALRSLKAPGTAYDDDVLGKDPQPSTMSGYVESQDDNGGVHINSGIPNHAFYILATSLGGRAWDTAGVIWYRTLTAGGLTADASFSEFAAATVEAARSQFDDEVVAAVQLAWRSVEVNVGDPDAPPTGAPEAQLIVERSGGVAGISRTWRMNIDAHSDDLGKMLRTLPWRAAGTIDDRNPDHFQYRIRCTFRASAADDFEVSLAESELTATWREIIEWVRTEDHA
ncbi:M4 family metallopeptidase [Paramicrobacterium chengjingii]|uniref:Neutral metalloproteinase n=1 Tax=Paramicrobacterium chengjingii TaxID=2769067 RepID=A0ABX6YEI1_9MICO|nr:M4 family metallopeptidase [Microbacterium chengjingii]